MQHSSNSTELSPLRPQDGIRAESHIAPSSDDPDQKGRKSHERPKRALTSRIPVVEFLVHSIALGTICALFWVNFSNHFKSNFQVKMTERRNLEIKLLQLGAKLHELVMLSSLSFIVFHYMRKLLTGRNGIPFGLVGAPYVTQSPATVVKQPFLVGFRHSWPFGLLLVVVCVLSVLVGPSSAIAMIPSLNWFELKEPWPKGDQTIWYANRPAHEFPTDQLWPTVFNAADWFNSTGEADCKENSFISRVYCPAAGYPDIWRWVRLPRVSLWSDKETLYFLTRLV